MHFSYSTDYAIAACTEFSEGLMKFIVVASVAFFEGAETLSVEILFTLEQFEIAYNAAVCVTRGDFRLAVMTNLYPIVDLHIRVGLDLFGIFILVVIISALHKHGLRWPRRPSRVRAGRPRRAAGVIRRASRAAPKRTGCVAGCWKNQQERAYSSNVPH